MSSISENVDDRLRLLPDEILSRILSLMPTKFAVRTSVLSKRWRYTWTSVTDLDFDYTRYVSRRSTNEDIVRKFDDGNEKNFIEFVDQVLKLYKTLHVNLFRLHVSSYAVPRPKISSWIDNAVRLNVRELDVCVIHNDLPLSVFTCKTLTSLRLELSACDFVGWEFPSSPIYLPCLKTLDTVGWTGPLADAFKLIRGCPVLESLSFEVSCCSNEEKCVFNIPTLKWLKLIFRVASSHESNSILCVPKLEYLFVGGILCSLFVMKDVSSLVGASIACWESTLSYLRADLLNKIRGVHSLSIENITFVAPLPIFLNMKQLELTGLWACGQITQFLESCPELKVLCIDFVHWRGFKPEESEKLIPACMLTKLTTIKFSKCDGDASDFGFLEYMLGNAQVLKAVTVFARESLLITETHGSVHRWLCFQGFPSIVKSTFDLGNCLQLRNPNTTTLMKKKYYFDCLDR